MQKLFKYIFTYIFWKNCLKIIITKIILNGDLRSLISLSASGQREKQKLLSGLIKVPEFAHWVLLPGAPIRGGCAFFPYSRRTGRDTAIHESRHTEIASDKTRVFSPVMKTKEPKARLIDLERVSQSFSAQSRTCESEARPVASAKYVSIRLWTSNTKLLGFVTDSLSLL